MVLEKLKMEILDECIPISRTPCWPNYSIATSIHCQSSLINEIFRSSLIVNTRMISVFLPGTENFFLEETTMTWNLHMTLTIMMMKIMPPGPIVLLVVSCNSRAVEWKQPQKYRKLQDEKNCKIIDPKRSNTRIENRGQQPKDRIETRQNLVRFHYCNIVLWLFLFLCLPPCHCFFRALF